MASDPRIMQERLHALFGSIIKAAGREPGLILFDDLHWIDPVSESALAAIIEATAGTRILVVVNFRPRLQGALDELAALSRPAFARDWVLPIATPWSSDLLGDAPEVEAVRAQVAARCGGNPFFAEELVRSLPETRVLAGEAGHYRLGSNPASVSLPSSVEAVVGARIDRLPEPVKALLQVGAIIGKEFPVALLQEVTAHAAPKIGGSAQSPCGSRTAH